MATHAPDVLGLYDVGSDAVNPERMFGSALAPLPNDNSGPESRREPGEDGERQAGGVRPLEQ